MKAKASGILAVVVLLVIGVFAGYYFSQNKPNRTVIPTDTANWDKELAPALAKLSDDDKRLAAAYLARAKLGELFGGAGIPSGLTIDQAIREQRNWEQAQAANDAEAKKLETRIKAEKEAVAKQISDLLTVALIDKRYVPHDYQSHIYSDSIVINIAFQNKGNKDIAGVKGKTIFTDMFGDVIKMVSLSYDEGIPAGKSVTWVGSVDYNQFQKSDVRLRDIDKAKLQFSFEPETVIFADGTKISSPSVPAR
jgi:hypothetical protein